MAPGRSLMPKQSTLTRQTISRYLLIAFDGAYAEVKLDIDRYFPFLNEDLPFAYEDTSPYIAIEVLPLSAPTKE